MQVELETQQDLSAGLLLDRMLLYQLGVLQETIRNHSMIHVYAMVLAISLQTTQLQLLDDASVCQALLEDGPVLQIASGTVPMMPLLLNFQQAVFLMAIHVDVMLQET